MTLTLLDLYNDCALQEWSMYDSGVTTTSEMESSLVLALNKALTEIIYSYPFKFRERTHIDFTYAGVEAYEMPFGLIMKDKSGDYKVTLNGKKLRLIDKPSELEPKCGFPEGFYIKRDEIILYPTPCSKFILSIDYYTLALGEDSNGEEILKLSNANDKVDVPEHLEEILKQAVISRAMLSTISSEGDENFSAYKKQSETAYRQLVKYSKGWWQDKSVKI